MWTRELPFWTRRKAAVDLCVVCWFVPSLLCCLREKSLIITDEEARSSHSAQHASYYTRLSIRITRTVLDHKFSIFCMQRIIGNYGCNDIALLCLHSAHKSAHDNKNNDDKVHVNQQKKTQYEL